MKKIITSLVALALTATPALADSGRFQENPYQDHRGSNAGPIILGILGGIIIGSIVADPNRDEHRREHEYRDYPQPAPEYSGREDYPQRPTARCMDGYLGFQYEGRYICYRHGGVRYWF